LDKKKTQHNRIRRVSIDKFYDIVTEEENAFYKLCRELPRIIEKVIFESDKVQTPYDTVYDELISQMGKEESSITLAMFTLGFGEYEGFSKLEE